MESSRKKLPVFIQLAETTQCLSTIVSIAGTAVFLLMAVGHVGSGSMMMLMLPILEPSLMIASVLLAGMKFTRAFFLRQEIGSVDSNADTTRSSKTSLFSKEAVTGLCLLVSAASAFYLFCNPTVLMPVLFSSLVAQPVLAVATLGLFINALNDLSINYHIWQRLQNSLGNQNQNQNKQILSEALTFMISSLIKVIGYTVFLIGSMASTASFAHLFVGAGLATVAGSNFNNNRGFRFFPSLSSTESKNKNPHQSIHRLEHRPS